MDRINNIMKYNNFFNSLPKDEKSIGYISGSMFINIARKYNENIPKYGKYMQLRKKDNLSTSRRDFFKDVLDMFSLDIQNLIMEECKVKS